MRYLLNSAVITTPGEYTYRLVPVEAARTWCDMGDPPVSTIGYQETADALAELLGRPVALDRRAIEMAEGDSALVFRLKFPPGTARINPGDKGALGRALLAGHYELGLLVRQQLSPPSASVSPLPDDDPDIVAARAAMARQEQALAANLRRLMAEKRLTQADLAERVGVSQPAISMLLACKYRPQRRTVRLLAQALGAAEKDLWPVDE